MNSFCAILEEAAAEVPDKPLFVFPESRWRSAERLSYGELASRSGAAAGAIAEQAKPGERALLLFPTGAAFWEAFMGCLAARVVAVPLNIPNLNRSNQRLQEVCRDCTPSLLVTNQNTADLLSRQPDKHPHLSQLPVITPERWRSEPCEFALDRVARTTHTCSFRVTTLNHKTCDYSVKYKSVIESLLNKINKIMN